MGNTNSVLRALSVLSLEEILKLSSSEEEILAFEQVAGGEWINAPQAKRSVTQAKILSFPTSHESGALVRDLEPLQEEGESGDFGGLNELSLDFILTQREFWKRGVESMGLAAAIEEYLRLLQVISIKESSEEGKEKIRFITTQGLLVDKKQN